jgi:hypothetical protein
MRCVRPVSAVPAKNRARTSRTTWSLDSVPLSRNVPLRLALCATYDPIKRQKVHPNSPERQSVDDWLADHAGAKVTPIQPQSPVSSFPSTNDSNDEGVVEEHALIPEGEYQAWYLEHELHENFKGYGDKLVVSFSVTDTDYAGEIVNSYYNVTITKTGFKAKGGSRWVREIRRLFPLRKRKDRLPPSLLKNRNVLVEVRTVKKGSKQRTLDPEERYSVVANILRLLN